MDPNSSMLISETGFLNQFLALPTHGFVILPSLWGGGLGGGAEGGAGIGPGVFAWIRGCA